MFVSSQLRCVQISNQVPRPCQFCHVFDDQHPGWLWFCTVPRIIMRSFICGNSRPTQFIFPPLSTEPFVHSKTKEEQRSSFEFTINNKETTKAATNGSKTKRNMEVHLNSSTRIRQKADPGTGWSGWSVCPSPLYRRE